MTRVRTRVGHRAVHVVDSVKPVISGVTLGAGRARTDEIASAVAHVAE